MGAQSEHQMQLVKNDHIPFLAKSLFLFGFLLFSELSNEFGNVLQHSIPWYYGKVTFPSFNENGFKCICDILHMHAFCFILLLFFLSIALFVFDLIILVLGVCLLFAKHLCNKHSSYYA